MSRLRGNVHLGCCLLAYLKVSIDDSFFMQVVYCAHDFRAVKPGSFFRELTLPGQMEVEFATIDIFGDKTKSIDGGEGVLERQEERVVRLLEHSFLRHGVLNFIFLDDHFFLEDFHGVQLVGSLFSAQNDFAESAFAQNFEKLEIFECLKSEEKIYEALIPEYSKLAEINVRWR